MLIFKIIFKGRDGKIMPRWLYTTEKLKTQYMMEKEPWEFPRRNKPCLWALTFLDCDCNGTQLPGPGCSLCWEPPPAWAIISWQQLLDWKTFVFWQLEVGVKYSLRRKSEVLTDLHLWQQYASQPSLVSLVTNLTLPLLLIYSQTLSWVLPLSNFKATLWGKVR